MGGWVCGWEPSDLWERVPFSSRRAWQAARFNFLAEKHGVCGYQMSAHKAVAGRRFVAAAWPGQMQFVVEILNAGKKPSHTHTR